MSNLFVSVVYLCFVSLYSCMDSKKSRTEILKLLLEDNEYDSRLVPDFELNVPTNITVQMFIQNIHSISESTMDYSLNVFLHQTWQDRRLQYPNMTSEWLELDNKMMDKVWTPDTFFANEKEARVHEVTALNKLMHLYKNGTIMYSIRLSLRLTCAMRFHKYPFDTQKCPIYIESYAYTNSNIYYYWAHDGIRLADNMEMPQFEPEKDVALGNCVNNYGKAGEFSCIKAILIFHRKIGYYIVQIYIPSILIVALSWISFWVDYEAVPARVSLGIMTVLTMTTQSSGARQSLPAVSYIKAIDVWMSVCLLFVFTSLLECAYVNVLARRKQTANAYRSIPVSDNIVQTQQAKDNRESRNLKGSNNSSNNTHHHTQHPGILARRVDKNSRIIFPLLYTIFNITFWVYYFVIPDP